jgi:hypothetical protein
MSREERELTHVMCHIFEKSSDCEWFIRLDHVQNQRINLGQQDGLHELVDTYRTGPQ